jgi:hypothetical protein
MKNSTLTSTRTLANVAIKIAIIFLMDHYWIMDPIVIFSATS